LAAIPSTGLGLVAHRSAASPRLGAVRFGAVDNSSRSAADSSRLGAVAASAGARVLGMRQRSLHLQSAFWLVSGAACALGPIRSAAFGTVRSEAFGPVRSASDFERCGAGCIGAAAAGGRGGEGGGQAPPRCRS